MVSIPASIREMFFAVIEGEIDINEFENWIYENKGLEDILSNDDYLELISLDYKKKGAKYEVNKILEKYVDIGELETRKLRSLLKSAKNRDEHVAESIAEFYNLYCHGYYFLRNLGLVYGLMIEVPPKDFKGDCWDDLNPEEKETLIASFYPSIIEEIDKVNKWLENRSIVLTGKQNDIGMWEYIDRRQEDEKKTTSYQVAQEINLSHKRRWWKFWK